MGLVVCENFSLRDKFKNLNYIFYIFNLHTAKDLPKWEFCGYSKIKTWLLCIFFLYCNVISGKLSISWLTFLFCHLIYWNLGCVEELLCSSDYPPPSFTSNVSPSCCLKRNACFKVKHFLVNQASSPPIVEILAVWGETPSVFPYTSYLICSLQL